MRRTKRVLLALLWVAAAASTAWGEDYEALAGSEQLAIADTFQYALENNKSEVGATWVNPDSGNSGATVPVRTFQRSDGTYCREFTQTIVIGGREEQGYGTACRQPDGSWRIVDDAEGQRQVQAATPVIRRTIVYVNDWPYRYYDPGWRYYPAYAPFPIFFSFSYSNYSRHLHDSGRYYYRPPLHRHRHDRPPVFHHDRDRGRDRHRSYYPGSRDFRPDHDRRRDLRRHQDFDRRDGRRDGRR